MKIQSFKRNLGCNRRVRLNECKSIQYICERQSKVDQKKEKNEKTNVRKKREKNRHERNSNKGKMSKKNKTKIQDE